MPKPVDVAGVRRLCGMIQYMSRLLPDLAKTLEPMRALTRKDTPFVWSTECENAFVTLKKNLSESPCLAYFESTKEVVIQVDSSKHGISQIEKEALSVLYDEKSQNLLNLKLKRKIVKFAKFATAFNPGHNWKFNQHTYGRPVKVENDHKPLATCTILRKPLTQAPKRLQDIMMQYDRYGIQLVFVKGKLIQS